MAQRTRVGLSKVGLYVIVSNNLDIHIYIRVCKCAERVLWNSVFTPKTEFECGCKKIQQFPRVQYPLTFTLPHQNLQIKHHLYCSSQPGLVCGVLTSEKAAIDDWLGMQVSMKVLIQGKTTYRFLFLWNPKGCAPLGSVPHPLYYFLKQGKSFLTVIPTWDFWINRNVPLFDLT